jgi:GT2 family glycosyltransferase
MNDDIQLLDLKPRPNFYPTYCRVKEKCSDARLNVAVIMRTKNRPLLLHRALSSVLLQSYEQWQLYLVNDGGCRREVEEVVARYERIFADRLTVLHNAESLGMERATNMALSQAGEDLVVIHDDDDSWHPDFLAMTTAFLSRSENRHYVGAITGCTLIYEKIEQDNVCEVSRALWRHARNVIDFRSMLVENRFPPICLVFHRSVVDSIGGFHASLPVLGDWEFNIRLLLLGDIGFIDRPLANYHHRVAGTNSVYSNTVVDGAQVHEIQNILLRNSVMRSALSSQPEVLGLLQPILHALFELERQMYRIEGAVGKALLDHGVMTERQERIEMYIGEMRQTLLALRQMLRPFGWLWRRALPIRRVIARARGRIP